MIKIVTYNKNACRIRCIASLLQRRFSVYIFLRNVSTCEYERYVETFLMADMMADQLTAAPHLKSSFNNKYRFRN
jgi:hypothetical protein